MSGEDGTGEAGREPPAGERPRWLDRKRNVDLIVYCVYGACGLLLLLDLLAPRYGPFAIEHQFGFYAVFGFVAYVVLVVLAEGLRAMVKRPEDYYDR